MKLTHYGRREWLGYGIVALVIACASSCAGLLIEKPLTGYVVSGIVVFAYVCLAAFFRDPHRIIPENPAALLSPADGAVRDIELVKNSDENSFFGNKGAVRVGIFLSIFDVHINRAPCDLTVVSKKYKPGKFHDARNPLASSENESMTIFCSASVEGKSFPLIIRQISGAIAKRIVCDVHEGSKLEKGQRFGMLKFGSRTELFIPAEQWLSTSVKVGDKVLAGLTTVAAIKPDTEKPRSLG
ncbi:MAG: phosphatidylserine decarboxylase family protein [Victivallales bacterium]|nr:phosphatidylserine decarboxylase family protein [Victivallales bacterium]